MQKNCALSEICDPTLWNCKNTLRILYASILSTEFSRDENWKDFHWLSALICELGCAQRTSMCGAKFRFVLHFIVVAFATDAIRYTRAVRLRTKSQSMNTFQLSSFFSCFFLSSEANAYKSSPASHHIIVWIIVFPCKMYPWERSIWFSAGSHFTLHSNYIDLHRNRETVFDQTMPRPPATISYQTPVKPKIFNTI